MYEQRVASNIESAERANDILNQINVALGNKDDDGFYVALELFDEHLSLCMSQGLLYALQSSSNAAWSAISEMKANFNVMAFSSPIKVELLQMLCKCFGHKSYLLYNAGGGSTDFSNKPSKSMIEYKYTAKEHAVLYAASLQEYLADPKKMTHAANLMSCAEHGEYESLAYAINTLAKTDKAAHYLSELGLFSALDRYKPVKRTRHNYLKLPCALKQVMVDHSDLLLKTFGLEKNKNNFRCGVWVAKELYDCELRDLALEVLKGNLTDEKGIGYSVKNFTGQRSFGVLGLLRKMDASDLLDGVVKYSHSKMASTNYRLDMLAASVFDAFEFSLNDEQFRLLATPAFDHMMRHKDLTSTPIAMVAVELNRNYAASEVLASRLTELNSLVGRFAVSCAKGHVTPENTQVMNLVKDMAKDLIPAIKGTPGFRSASLCHDMGL